MKNRNWFWGVFFLVAAVFVLASQFGSFGHIGLFSILATVLLVALLIEGLIDRNFFGIFVPIAFLYMIYQQPLHLVVISIWLLLLAAVLASTGLSMIFHKHPHYHCHDKHEEFYQTTENIDDNNPYAKVSFGSSSKYLHGDCIKTGQFTSSFGALEVFFDQAQLNPEGAEIFLDCSFATIKLYIPRHWIIRDNVRASLGSVENDVRLNQPAENAPRLTLSGTVQFGSVEIHYI